MADKSSFPYTASASFKREHLKPGKHIMVLPMDDNLTSLIGWVIAYWVQFEEMFNGLIACLLLAAERVEPNWQRRSFQKRKDLLKELLAVTTFERNDQEGRKQLVDILGAASDLQWRRNLVAHGNYQCTLGPYSSDASWHTTGTHNGRNVSLPLDPATLEKLRHDLAHLCGDFTQFVGLIGEYQPGFAVALPDTQILQLFEDWDRKNPPTEQTPPPPPQP